jgi:outer membrane immunogenic protein
MRRFVLGALAALAGLWALPAQAQQTFRTNAGPGVADFSGVAFGPDLGLAFGSTSGGAFGGHVGYNLQSGQLVGGVEADAMFSNLSNSGAFSLNEKFLTSIRGKAGYAFGDFLAYGTLGVGFSTAQYNNWFGSRSTTLTGAVFGVGGEYALTRNVSLRAEYLRYQFGDISYSAWPYTGQSMTASTNLLRVGASIHF